MQWTPGGTSGDIEDRRGEGGGGGGFGFGGGGFGMGGLGIGGTLVLLILSLFFRTNLFSLFSGGGAPSRPAAHAPVGAADRSPGEHREVEFVSFVLDDVQHTWDAQLP